MAVRAQSGALQGVDAVPIDVEVDLLRRLPAVAVVGLPASAVKESAERVRSAIVSAGFEFPRMRVVVNLAPADVRKEGTALDLPIALGILAAAGVVPEAALETVLCVGELSLDGRLRPVRGALSLGALAAAVGRVLIAPAESAADAAMVPDATVLAARDLAEVVAHLRGERTLTSARPLVPTVPPPCVDLSDVRGQTLARRALEIAAAGGHHVFFLGPPGCGKSMLARRLATILPPMTFAEVLEAARIRSAAGLETGSSLHRARPFRAPHHSVTTAGLIGDRTLRPGEVSLAHGGVLFLDEATEFRRSALEVLREPLEQGVVRVTRASGSIEYPAAFTLVLAANPCPCGQLGGCVPCVCSPTEVMRYRRKLSGPLLDRIDLHVELSPVLAHELLDGPSGEPSGAVRERVSAARALQRARGQRGANALLSSSDMETHGALCDEASELLIRGMQTHSLTARAVARIRNVARTIADLDACTQVRPHHIAEALAYRPAAGTA